MKTLIAALLLFTLPAVAKEKHDIEFNIGVAVLVMPERSARAKFDGETLVVSSAKKEIHREILPMTDVAEIRKILGSAKKAEWSAYYFNVGVLDGSVIRFTAKNGDKDLDFEGWNGAPPGFHAIIALVNRKCGREVLHVPEEKTLLQAMRFRDKAEFEEYVRNLATKKD